MTFHKACIAGAISLIVKRFYIFFLLGCLLLPTACSEARLEIKEAWIAEAPPNAAAQAGYMILQNDTPQPMTLLGVTSDAFEQVQIHKTEYEQTTGLVAMHHKDKVAIPSQRIFRFEPGGYHLMLLKPKSPLREGDQVVMSLNFADGSRFNVVFAVRREKFTL